MVSLIEEDLDGRRGNRPTRGRTPRPHDPLRTPGDVDFEASASSEGAPARPQRARKSLEGRGPLRRPSRRRPARSFRPRGARALCRHGRARTFADRVLVHRGRDRQDGHVRPRKPPSPKPSSTSSLSLPLVFAGMPLVRPVWQTEVLGVVGTRPGCGPGVERGPNTKGGRQAEMSRETRSASAAAFARSSRSPGHSVTSAQSRLRPRSRGRRLSPASGPARWHSGREAFPVPSRTFPVGRDSPSPRSSSSGPRVITDGKGRSSSPSSRRSWSRSGAGKDLPRVAYNGGVYALGAAATSVCRPPR